MSVAIALFSFYRVLFNKTVDKLCSKLEELDGIVATSVADQVAQAYVQPSAAIDHLMGAIVTSSSPVDDVNIITLLTDIFSCTVIGVC